MGLVRLVAKWRTVRPPRRLHLHRLPGLGHHFRSAGRRRESLRRPVVHDRRPLHCGQAGRVAGVKGAPAGAAWHAAGGHGGQEPRSHRRPRRVRAGGCRHPAGGSGHHPDQGRSRSRPERHEEALWHHPEAGPYTLAHRVLRGSSHHILFARTTLGLGFYARVSVIFSTFK